MKHAIYVSATPGVFEVQQSHGLVVEQIIRPTGLLDPEIEVRPAANQIERLAQFILREMPGEPEGGEGAVDTAIRLLRNWVPVPCEGERYWACKIGPMTDEELSGVEDSPFRILVQGVFEGLFGRGAESCSSGWGAHLTQGERRAKDYFQDGTPRKVFVGDGTVPLSPEEIDLIEKAAGPDGGTKEGATPAGTEESSDVAFSRLAPGGDGCGAASKDTI